MKAFLAFIAIFLAAPLCAQVTISCVAPTQNTDGSALTDLASFRFYYGAAAGQLTQSVTSTTCNATVSGLAPGTWYFAVAAINAAGVESDKSVIVAQLVSPPPDPCKLDPLVFIIKGWPGANIGSRSASWSTAQPLTKIVIEWPLKITATDARGCTVSVTR